MHFFNPVPVMALIEIVRGLQTGDATHDVIDGFARQLGKSPITVKNAPGFVVNRLLLPMLNEAFFVLGEGDASAAEIDQGMKLGCNHPMGPLALADLIGLDVLLSVMDIIHAVIGDPSIDLARSSENMSKRDTWAANPAGASSPIDRPAVSAASSSTTVRVSQPAMIIL